MNNSVDEALIKKATGFYFEEVTEEYQDEEGEIKLVKKKVTKKFNPPDITAIKMIKDQTETPVINMTDEELESEKQRLLAELLNEDRLVCEKERNGKED